MQVKHKTVYTGYTCIIDLLGKLEELEDEIGEVQGSVEVRGGTHSCLWRLSTLTLTAMAPGQSGKEEGTLAQLDPTLKQLSPLLK